MIDLDRPTFAAFLIIMIAFWAPYLYSFFIDKYCKDTPDPRRRSF